MQAAVIKTYLLETDKSSQISVYQQKKTASKMLNATKIHYSLPYSITVRLASATS